MLIQAIAGLGQPSKVRMSRIEKIHLRLRAVTDVENETASLFQSNVKSRWSPTGRRDRTLSRRRVRLLLIGGYPWDWVADAFGDICVTDDVRPVKTGLNILPIPDA